MHTLADLGDALVFIFDPQIKISVISLARYSTSDLS
jgi:hypothetical protein